MKDRWNVNKLFWSKLLFSEWTVTVPTAKSSIKGLLSATYRSLGCSATMTIKLGWRCAFPAVMLLLLKIFVNNFLTLTILWALLYLPIVQLIKFVYITTTISLLRRHEARGVSSAVSWNGVTTCRRTNLCYDRVKLLQLLHCLRHA